MRWVSPASDPRGRILGTNPPVGRTRRAQLFEEASRRTPSCNGFFDRSPQVNDFSLLEVYQDLFGGVPCLEAERAVVWGSPARTPRQEGPGRVYVYMCFGLIPNQLNPSLSVGPKKKNDLGQTRHVCLDSKTLSCLERSGRGRRSGRSRERRRGVRPRAKPKHSMGLAYMPTFTPETTPI